MSESLRLRAFTEDDLWYLDRWGADPEAVGPFEWPGHLDPRRRRRRFEKDGWISAELTALAVALPDDKTAGVISYWPKQHGGPGGGVLEIGIALLPEHRGRGLGTLAQRMLLDYLFGYTSTYRIEALTDDENLAEQKALERAGFRREGVLRGSYFHRGQWRNLVSYAVLRPEYER